jgi:hypothetical protein
MMLLLHGITQLRRITLPRTSVHKGKEEAVSNVFSEGAAREISRSRTGPSLPIEQIALYEGVYSALDRLEEGRHQHGPESSTCVSASSTCCAVTSVIS